LIDLFKKTSYTVHNKGVVLIFESIVEWNSMI